MKSLCIVALCACLALTAIVVRADEAEPRADEAEPENPWDAIPEEHRPHQVEIDEEDLKAERELEGDELMEWRHMRDLRARGKHYVDEKHLYPTGITKVVHGRFMTGDRDHECEGKPTHMTNYSHGHCDEDGQRYTCRNDFWCQIHLSTCNASADENGAQKNVHRHSYICGQCEGRKKLIDCDTVPKLLECEDDECTKCETKDAPQAGCDTEDDQYYEYKKCQVVVHEMFTVESGKCEPWEFMHKSYHPAGEGTCMSGAQWNCEEHEGYTHEHAKEDALKEHELYEKNMQEYEDEIARLETQEAVDVEHQPTHEALGKPGDDEPTN